MSLPNLSNLDIGAPKRAYEPGPELPMGPPAQRFTPPRLVLQRMNTTEIAYDKEIDNTLMMLSGYIQERILRDVHDNSRAGKNIEISTSLLSVKALEWIIGTYCDSYSKDDVKLKDWDIKLLQQLKDEELKEVGSAAAFLRMPPLSEAVSRVQRLKTPWHIINVVPDDDPILHERGEAYYNMDGRLIIKREATTGTYDIWITEAVRNKTDGGVFPPESDKAIIPHKTVNSKGLVKILEYCVLLANAEDTMQDGNAGWDMEFVDNLDSEELFAVVHASKYIGVQGELHSLSAQRMLRYLRDMDSETFVQTFNLDPTVLKAASEIGPGEPLLYDPDGIGA